MGNDNVKKTENKRGFSYELPKHGKSFVEFSATVEYPVMDIGAAFGVATIPALEKGARVFAVDIDFSHLNAILTQTPKQHIDQLSILNLKFPDFDMPEQSLGAVYLSQVLPFMDGGQVEEGISKISKWLIPGGKIFIVSFSPYLKHCASYIPVYEDKLKKGVKWAGYIDDLKFYSNNNPIAANLPNQINHVDVHDIERVLKEHSFEIEVVEYFGDEHDDLPEGIKYDDRERVGAIGIKK